MSGFVPEKAPYLVREAKTKRWHFRLRVPAPLVPVFGKFIWRNLNTADFQAAQKQRDKLLAHYKAEFRRLRQAPAVILAAERERIEASVLSASPTVEERDKATADLAEVVKLVLPLLPATVRAVMNEAGGPAAFMLRHASSERGADMLEETINFRPTLADIEDTHPDEMADILRAQIEMVPMLEEARDTLAKQKGILASIGLGTPMARAKHDPNDPATWTVSILCDEWLKASRQQPQTARKWRLVVRRFLEHLGDDPLACGVTKLQVSRFISDMQRMPAPEGLPKGMTHATVPRLLAWMDTNPTDDKGKPRATLGPATVGRYVTGLRALFSFGVKIDAVIKNPAATIDKPVDPRGKSEKRRGQTKDELRRFLAAADAKWGATDPKTLFAKLAIFTGLRRLEGVGLRPDDLFEDQTGGLCIFIRATEDRTLKTTGSDRTVPVHSQIADALRAYKASRPAGAVFLFDLPGSTAEKKADRLGASFRKLLNSIGITSRNVAPIHSFRHAFETEAKDVIEHDQAALAITGRLDDNKSRRVYGKPPTLATLRKWIEKMDPLGLTEVA